MPDLNFKRGLSTKNQPPIIDGQIIYHIDTSRFYLDVDNARIEINANDAKKLMGAELTNEILRYTNELIPTSNLVRNELNKKISAEVSGEVLKLWTKKIYNKEAGYGIIISFEENMTWQDWLNSDYYYENTDLYWSNNALRCSFLEGSIYAPLNGYIDINADFSGAFQDCCFIAGTQILISLSGQTQSIETINSGDQVVSYNIETGENYLTTVKKLILNKNSTHMAKIKFDNGTIIEMTDYHPLYTINGWSSLTKPEYRKLILGDIVKTNDGWSKIIDIEQYQLNKPIITYTLDVRDSNEIMEDYEINDNFYANGIVAHNADCPV